MTIADPKVTVDLEILPSQTEIAWLTTAYAFGEIEKSQSLAEITAEAMAQRMRCERNAALARKADLAGRLNLSRAMKRGNLNDIQRSIVALNKAQVTVLLSTGCKMPTRQERTRFGLPWDEHKVVLFRARNHKSKDGVRTSDIDTFVVGTGVYQCRVNYLGRKTVLRDRRAS